MATPRRSVIESTLAELALVLVFVFSMLAAASALSGSNGVGPPPEPEPQEKDTRTRTPDDKKPIPPPSDPIEIGAFNRILVNLQRNTQQSPIGLMEPRATEPPLPCIFYMTGGAVGNVRSGEDLTTVAKAALESHSGDAGAPKPKPLIAITSREQRELVIEYSLNRREWDERGPTPTYYVLTDGVRDVLQRLQDGLNADVFFKKIPEGLPGQTPSVRREYSAARQISVLLRKANEDLKKSLGPATVGRGCRFYVAIDESIDRRALSFLRDIEPNAPILRLR